MTLTPTASFTVQGDSDPASWLYLCTLNGPSTSRAITLPAASVVHVRYAAPASQPWKGRSPLQLACDTGRAAALLEHATSEEFSFVQQQILSPRRNPNEYGTDSLTPDLITKIVESFSAHTGSGAMIVPGDLEPRRLGPSPPDSFALYATASSAASLTPDLIGIDTIKIYRDGYGQRPPPGIVAGVDRDDRSAAERGASAHHRESHPRGRGLRRLRQGGVRSYAPVLGRPSLAPPDFRLLLLGYFEGLD